MSKTKPVKMKFRVFFDYQLCRYEIREKPAGWLHSFDSWRTSTCWTYAEK